MKKIIVAHPGKQHSYRLASSLKKEGLLFKYITTVYDKKTSYIMRVIKLIVGEDSLKRANTRRNLDLDDKEVVQFAQISGLFLLLLIRIDKKGKIVKHFNAVVAKKFGKKVAEYAIRNKVDAVIMYDTTATTCFEILQKKAPNIKRILDVSIANRRFTRNFIDNNLSNVDLNEYKEELPVLWNEEILKNSDKEMTLSSYFLVASTFVKNSLMFAGIKENRIKVVPYGVDIDKFSIVEDKSNLTQINFLFVGQLNSRKGIKYLLEAFSEFDEEDVQLTLVGRYDEKSKWFQEFSGKQNIKFLGSLQHDQLTRVYNKSDIFILPSISEGMALVGLEALSTGLPLICSENSGVNDLIVDELNGFTIPAANTVELKGKIRWFIDNAEKIPQMKKNARNSVLKYTWNDYEVNSAVEIKSIVYSE